MIKRRKFRDGLSSYYSIDSAKKVIDKMIKDLNDYSDELEDDYFHLTAIIGDNDDLYEADDEVNSALNYLYDILNELKEKY